jgi:hypothetical protein
MGVVGRPAIDGIFNGAGPTKQCLMDQTVFFTDPIFLAANFVFPAWNGLNEQGLVHGNMMGV